MSTKTHTFTPLEDREADKYKGGSAYDGDLVAKLNAEIERLRRINAQLNEIIDDYNRADKQYDD